MPDLNVVRGDLGFSHQRVHQTKNVDEGIASAVI
jgi:hypothetical protein